MKKLLLTLALIVATAGLISSCATVPYTYKPVFTKEAVAACDEYCGGNGTLLYRDKTTHFCECNCGRVVVGRLGTIYK